VKPGNTGNPRGVSVLYHATEMTRDESQRFANQCHGYISPARTVWNVENFAMHI
jgi:hypothetical protein